jgi:regulator of sigma E protease
VPAAPLTLREWLARNSTVLVIVALGLYGLWHWLGPSGMWTAFLVAVGLGLVIFIHELGHFLVAKWCDVHVETFSIGFGPPLPGCQFKKGETTYQIAVVPLGGYVKMVGENPEHEEEENDPRSFKNKRVWQRMAIISAGVFMNLVLGSVCFAIAYSNGVDVQPATVGYVDAGSPSWELGIKSGDVFEQVGNIRHPMFDQVKYEVILSGKEPLRIKYSRPGFPEVDTFIQPRLGPDRLMPMIGYGPPEQLTLIPEKAKKHFTTLSDEQSPAAAADFAWGDEIIGMTDPSANNQVTLLPDDPRVHDRKIPDYFEYYRRLKLLIGQKVTFKVRRAGATPDAAPTLVDVTVEPAFHRTFGLRMKMGRIVAVREPASKHDISPRDPKAENDGDTIERVEVKKPDGQNKSWVVAKGTAPGTEEVELDPVRLPFELQQWADSFSAGAQRPKVKVWVKGKKAGSGNEQAEKPVVQLDWDDRYRFDDERPLSSAIALPALGIAYQVTTSVESVQAKSPAENAKLLDSGEPFTFQKEDVISAICPMIKNPETREMKPRTRTKFFFFRRTDWSELPNNSWGSVSHNAQRVMSTDQVLVQVERGGNKFEVLLGAAPDRDWPMVSRGLRLLPQTQVLKANGLGQAVGMGFNKTFTWIRLIYRQLSALLTGDISYKNMSGPIGIAGTAYAVADTDLNMLILFLGIISVNLAVVNFLPIPILDGGHMVFLIYEGLRGKPASQAVFAAANYVGLGLIASLMLFVICLDFKRYFF